LSRIVAGADRSWPVTSACLRQRCRTTSRSSERLARSAQRKKKAFLSADILRCLPRRKECGERELRRFIETIHPDFCTIRRKFIIGGYMERSKSRYRLTDTGRAVLAK